MGANRPPEHIALTPGKRVLFLTKDLDLIKQQLYDWLDLRMEDLTVDDLLDDIPVGSLVYVKPQVRDQLAALELQLRAWEPAVGMPGRAGPPRRPAGVRAPAPYWRQENYQYPKIR